MKTAGKTRTYIQAENSQDETHWQALVIRSNSLTWEYMDPLETSRGGRGGAEDWSCQEGLLADRERLAAAIYGSRNRWIYFCLPVSLENNKRGSQPVRDCVSYQLLCLEGRGSMFIFERWLCDVSGKGGEILGWSWMNYYRPAGEGAWKDSVLRGKNSN